MGSKTSPASTSSTQNPSFNEALAVWASIGVLSFGGPAGQIASMPRVLVAERRWISEDVSCTRIISACCCRGQRPRNLRPMSAGCCTAPWADLPQVSRSCCPAPSWCSCSIAYALYGHVPLAAPGGESPARRFTYRGVLFGRDHVLTDISIFFSKLAVVTFGGAYSVLPTVAH